MWILPTAYYVVAVGALGVTGKLALRSLSWPDLILWSGVGYVIVAAGLLVTGQTSVRLQGDAWWAVLSAVLAITSLVSLYVALGLGDAGKVSAVSAAYPAVTLLIAAAVLSEPVTIARLTGMLLVVAGVVILTSGR